MLQFHSWVYIPKTGKEMLKQRLGHKCSPSSTIHNSKNVKTTQTPNNRCMDKQNVVLSIQWSILSHRKR